MSSVTDGFVVKHTKRKGVFSLVHPQGRIAEPDALLPRMWTRNSTQACRQGHR